MKSFTIIQVLGGVPVRMEMSPQFDTYIYVKPRGPHNARRTYVRG